MQNLFQFNQNNTVPEINGLQYISDFITEKEEADLIDQVDQHNWDSNLKRRVQHYGYQYDYTSRRVDPDSYLGDLPHFLNPIKERLQEHGYFPNLPDQCIVNEYISGQGISDHIDCVPCFGGVIASLSLGGGATMQFKYNGQKEDIYLEPRSLIILADSARYEWTHGIPARKSDAVQGFKISRARRISLTFRNMILDKI